MELGVKRQEHIVPSYSLTGDLLSYLRCRLQYRYHNRSSLPPSRPVQLWFGEFLHGTLEMAYRHWSERQAEFGVPPAFPWPCNPRKWLEREPNWEAHDIGKIANAIENSLRQRGIQARSSDARDSAYRRAEIAVNKLGPHLFPLIEAAERKVIGTRPVAPSDAELRCDNYEVHGVIDVLTHVTLSQARDDNLIRQCVQQACPDLQGTYEVIVDYKGARRPRCDEKYWNQDNWQIQTYAWLREHQPDSLPVAAGILIYLNELLPGSLEIKSLKQGIASKTTDIIPAPSSRDAQIVRLWRPGMNIEQLSLTYRLRRAIRIVQVSEQSIAKALNEFDDVVRRTEIDILEETNGRNILKAWSPTCDDPATCAACDFRHFCPKPARGYKQHEEDIL